jgi:hypothetical protein
MLRTDGAIDTVHTNAIIRRKRPLADIGLPLKDIKRIDHA